MASSSRQRSSDYISIGRSARLPGPIFRFRQSDYGCACGLARSGAEQGKWQFDTLDKYVTIAEQHNTKILLPLAVTPQWASARPNVKSGWQKPGFAAEPKDMNDWRSYVRQIVSRYKGRIAAYEIWNEPNLQQYWIGDTDQLVAMTKDAHDIIKSIDPAAILVSPSATTGRGIPWLADFLSKGGGRTGM